jgi:hypothetical protein
MEDGFITTVHKVIRERGGVNDESIWNTRRPHHL